MVTLASNFGTFLLYMLTNIVAIVAFREHHSFQGFKHMVVPVFGLLANLGCMLFYLLGPFSVAGMSRKEPLSPWVLPPYGASTARSTLPSAARRRAAPRSLSKEQALAADWRDWRSDL